MELPKVERRKLKEESKKTLWIYGSPFSGKTSFANQFPNPLMLNTDGNIKFVDAPYISIKDKVTVNGRISNRKYAWEEFCDVVAELEKKNNEFKTIVVDLVEDVYEHCRVFMCHSMGISHESDDSFKAYDIIRNQFLNVMKRLLNLDYENIILISHEDYVKDLTKKSGDKITGIKPNLNEKLSNKLAGMVDVVGRVISDGDKRILSFKNNEIYFGGGRLFNAEINLSHEALCKLYEERNDNICQYSISGTRNTTARR